LTPRSRSFAVAITVNPLAAWTSLPSSGIGRVFSDRIVIRLSWTSAGIRVSSSIRATLPSRIACIIGEGTSASWDGPCASSCA
jgi:hypothetical protein